MICLNRIVPRQLSSENSFCCHKIERRIINGQRGLSQNRQKIEQTRILRTGFKLSGRLTHGPASCTVRNTVTNINPLNPELNPICYLLALLGAHHFLHVSRIMVKLLTFRLLI